MKITSVFINGVKGQQIAAASAAVSAVVSAIVSAPDPVIPAYFPFGAGDNEYFQLGGTAKTDINFFRQISTSAEFVDVQTGREFALFLDRDGVVHGIGDNRYGQLGGFQYEAQVSSVIVISAEHQFEKIHSNYETSYGIKEDGTIWGIGYNSNNQLGDEISTSGQAAKLSWTQLSADTGWTDVALGQNLVVASRDGKVYAMGIDTTGIVGIIADSARYNVWTDTSAPSSAVAVAMGNNTAYYLDSENNLYGRGNSNNNRINTSTNGNITSWTLMDSNVAKIASKSDFIMYIKTDGTLWGQGQAAYGVMGLPTNNNARRQIGTDTDWDKVSCGYYISYSIKTDNTMYAMGYNNNGEMLTNPSITNTPTILTSAAVFAVAGGQFSTYILTDSETP